MIEKNIINSNKMFKKHNTFENTKIPKKLRRMGEKLIINEIKNLNNETNEIIEQTKDKIHFYNINIKNKNISIKQDLINNQINTENNNKISSDIIYKLISEKSLFKQRMLSNNICSITSKINNKKNKTDSLSEDKNNNSLSAFNPKNIEIIDKYNKNFKKDIKILNHISPINKFIRNIKYFDKSDSFNNYKNNYLNLRKTIGEWKKNEYEQLFNKILKTNANEEKGEFDNNYKRKDIFKYKFNRNKFKKQKILINAIIKADKDSTFPRFYLPTSGSTLLSRDEIQTKNNI